MEGSASQTSGTPYGEEWNAARARAKNTRVEQRGGKLRFWSGGGGRSEPIRSGGKLPAVRGWGVGWQPAGQRPPNKQARTPPASPTSSFHSDRTERNKNTSTLRHRRRESLAPLHRGNHDNNDGKKKRSLCGTFSCFPSVSRAVSDGCECGRAARTMGQFIAVRQQGCQGNLWAAAV